MNLIPIEPGTPSPGPVEPGTGAEGRFAELMAGLMSGDAQIAPVLDLPISGDAPLAGDQLEADTAAESLLAAIGTPPAGVVISDAVERVEQVGQMEQVADVAHITQTRRTVELSPAPADQQPPSGPAQPEATDLTPSDAPLASVHPLTRATVGKGTTEPQSPVSEAAAAPHRATVEAAEIELDNDHQTITPLRSSAPTAQPGATVTQPKDTQRVDAPLQLDSTQRAAAESAQVMEAPPTDPGLDVETSSLIRTPEASVRTAAVPSGPAMVGIARRVEEAIAALATKPDPKVVTLQLDELDGIRLTVALRPDGLHLSSNGQASLTGEIERALASRGFDMASDTPQRDPRGDADRANDDGWQPRFADRRHRTDRDGIRF